MNYQDAYKSIMERARIRVLSVDVYAINIGKSKKGKKQSASHAKNNGLARLGKKHSETSKHNMRLGVIRGWETRRKNALARMEAYHCK